MDAKKENLIMAVSTVVIGVLAGLGAVALGAFFEVVEHLFLGFKESASQPFAASASPLRRLASLAIGGVIVAIVWWLMRKKMRPTVSLTEAVKGDQMPPATMVVHTFTQILYVGAGGSVGREVAPRELGAMMSQVWQRLIQRVWHVTLTAEDRKLLVAAAAGAGFAGVYIAPITGMMFSVEILFKKISTRSVVVSLSMSVIAMLVGSLLKGFKPYYALNGGGISRTALPLILIIAPLCGLLGYLFRKAFQYAQKHQTRSAKILWQLPLVALLTGLIAMPFPQIMGNGRALAQTIFNTPSNRLILWFAIGALAKAVVTVLTLRAGASGGTLTPSLAIGATIGAIVAAVVNMLWPGSVVVWQGAMIGATAFLAVTQQAPLMALFMLIEVSHLNYSAFLPLGLGVCLALVIAHAFGWAITTRTNVDSSAPRADEQ